MIDQEKLGELVSEALSQEEAFLVDMQVDSDAKIRIEIDRSGGINLSTLTKVSRLIESEFDRDEEDYSLEVASPGVGTPFKVWEQYPANVGRVVKVNLKDGSEIKGDMISADEGKIVLTWKERVPKEKGKGKRTIEVSKEIEIKDIQQTKLEVRF